MNHETELMHYGTPRHSGRYPWGSGKDPYQGYGGFLGRVDTLYKQGLSEREVAQALGMSSTELRQRRAVAKNEMRKYNSLQAAKLKEKGLSNKAIAEKLGLPGESSVRSLLKVSENAAADQITNTRDILKNTFKDHDYVDVGAGVENILGVSRDKLATAVSMLEDEGYRIQYLRVPQLGTGEMTSLKVLVKPDVTWKDLTDNKDKIATPGVLEDTDGTISKLGLMKPRSISSKRVQICYDEDGGSEKDGLIEIRPGVPELSLGAARYAQTRIMVDGDRYLKGVAVYNPDLPEGIDIRYNQSKSKSIPKRDVLKKVKDDPDNPFGATVRQSLYIDPKTGKKQLSAINIVNEEQDWEKWSKNLPSQFLSKQRISLAKKQLGVTYDSKRSELDEILSLTNPVVKKRLLLSYSDDCDAASAKLKAAALPRQKTHVILPVPSLKDTEVFAPNYDNGEVLSLVRFPHGGIFEIPTLVVNNKNKEAIAMMGKNPKNAIGINAKVAAHLSGADFDGDTVLAIPNSSGAVKTSKPLKQLEGFDPKRRYPAYPGMKKVSEDKSFNTQRAMGEVSNLITDMTIKGASQAELARAVKHSMTVIDAEKHNLDWRASAADNNIRQLKTKYQGVNANGTVKGASTLLSKAQAVQRVPLRKQRLASEGGPIDPKTGRRVYSEITDPKKLYYIDKHGNKQTRTTKSKKMLEVHDAHILSSGTDMENLYADHANKLKALANEARISYLNTEPPKWDRNIAKRYPKETAELKAELNRVYKNKPLERKAQLVANVIVKEKVEANPAIKENKDNYKRLKGQALNAARQRVGAKKPFVDINPKQWEAIQAGAISSSVLSQILDNADIDVIRRYATPKDQKETSPAQILRIKQLKAMGRTQSEIARIVGVTVGEVNNVDRS